MNATAEYFENNTTNDFDEYLDRLMYSKKITFPLILSICCIGLPENRIVICLLGFQIKRNSFTVLILNLAIADFGFLILMAIYCTYLLTGFITSEIPWLIFISFMCIMNINGLFLLTAISIDRCVSVLFPIWHRCSRPGYLSPAVCAILWIFSLLLGIIRNITQDVFKHYGIWKLHLLVPAVLCCPLITTSTVILFIKIDLKSKQNKQERLLVMVLITLLCFLILTFPLHLTVFIVNFLDTSYFFEYLKLHYCLNLSACLNYTVNPVIYFLVGGKKQSQSKENLKVIFQRVFKEDGTPGALPSGLGHELMGCKIV